MHGEWGVGEFSQPSQSNQTQRRTRAALPTGHTRPCLATFHYALQHFDDGGVGGAEPLTDGQQTVLATATFELIDQGAHQLGAGGAQRVPQSLSATVDVELVVCLLYTSPSPRDLSTSRMPSSA